jgi:hypothetical protein
MLCIAVSPFVARCRRVQRVREQWTFYGVRLSERLDDLELKPSVVIHFLQDPLGLLNLHSIDISGADSIVSVAGCYNDHIAVPAHIQAI